ncbi:MAG TPA: cytochrome c3 family protein [Oligoflexia bacterium]|nr:cytochrome c3 family protein [Oligoflexia bacterium]
MRASTSGSIAGPAAVGLFFLAAALFFGSHVLAGTAPDGVAGGAAGALAGVWRGGKAVFSDWKFTDVFLPPRYRRGYRPLQPVAYSHRTHVEKLGMECQYCHFGVNKSAHAVIPSVDSCMGCHASVRSDLPEVQKLKNYWEQKKPVEWIPVSNLPEHVRFSHERHVRAGVACYICHGQVNKMDVVEKASSLKMGFCLSCHRESGAVNDCGACHH